MAEWTLRQVTIKVAREYFQKVLQLDADNEIARQATAEIDAMLERRKASVEPVAAPEDAALEVETQEERVRQGEKRYILLFGVVVAVLMVLVVLLAGGNGQTVTTQETRESQTSNDFAQRSTDILRQFIAEYDIGACDVARMRNLRWQWVNLEPPARVRAGHQCAVGCMDLSISACQMLSVGQLLDATDEMEKAGSCWRMCDALLKSLIE